MKKDNVRDEGKLRNFRVNFARRCSILIFILFSLVNFNLF